MKKYSLLLVFVFAAMTAMAQFPGSVSVTRQTLCKRGDSLYMQLVIRADGNIARTESWTIIPELSTVDRKSVKLFPHVVVNGKYQRRMALRRRILTGSHWVERQPYAVIEPDGKTEQVLRYEMTVPYETWMTDATLVLRQIQTLPGNVRRVFTIDVNGAVDMNDSITK